MVAFEVLDFVKLEWNMEQKRKSSLDIFTCDQGRNEVRWRPGQEAVLAPPCSKLRSFGSECSVLKKVLVKLMGLFGASRSHSAPLAVIWRPHGDSTPGELRPACPPRYAPACDMLLKPVAYGCHWYRVCAVCDVTLWRQIHISNPTFWRRLLKQCISLPTHCPYSLLYNLICHCVDFKLSAFQLKMQVQNILNATIMQS